MPETLLQGITISAIGISLTFAGILVIVAAIAALQRIFRPPPTKHETRPGSASLASGVEEEQVAAAIAVALTHLQSQAVGRSELGLTLESEPGRWWSAARGARSVQNRHKGR